MKWKSGQIIECHSALYSGIELNCSPFSEDRQAGCASRSDGIEPNIVVKHPTIRRLLGIGFDQPFCVVDGCLQVQEPTHKSLVAKLLKRHRSDSVSKTNELGFIVILRQSISSSRVIEPLQQVLQCIDRMRSNAFATINELFLAPHSLLVCMPPSPNDGKHRHDRLYPCRPVTRTHILLHYCLLKALMVGDARLSRKKVEP